MILREPPVCLVREVKFIVLEALARFRKFGQYLVEPHLLTQGCYVLSSTHWQQKPAETCVRITKVWQIKPDRQMNRYANYLDRVQQPQNAASSMGPQSLAEQLVERTAFEGMQQRFRSQCRLFYRTGSQSFNCSSLAPIFPWRKSDEAEHNLATCRRPNRHLRSDFLQFILTQFLLARYRTNSHPDTPTVLLQCRAKELFRLPCPDSQTTRGNQLPSGRCCHFKWRYPRSIAIWIFPSLRIRDLILPCSKASNGP